MTRVSFSGCLRLALALLVSVVAGTRGQVIINEIMYHPYEPWPASLPAKTTNDSEFVEIFNAGPAIANLAEYRFDNGITFDFPAGSTLAPDEYLVVCGNSNAFTNWYPTVTNFIGAYSGSLNNGGERVTLSQLVGGVWVTADTLQYYDFGKSDGEGPSLELIHPCFARLKDQYTGDWAASTTTGGTPGRQNSVYRSVPLPVVGDVRHEPPLPPEGSSIKITARVTGLAGDSMRAVQLKYRQDAVSQAAWTNTPMNDDGINGDDIGSDGIYTALLPPYGQVFSSGTLVEYQITATDATDSRTFPVTNTAGVVTGPYSFFCYWGEDAGFTGEYATYHILMTDSNKTRLWAQTGGGAISDTYPLIEGTLITSDGKIFHNCGFRQRGSTRASPYGYAVDLPAGQSYDGYQEVDFNFQRQFNNFLGMKIAAAAGVPASRVQLMRLWMNGSLLQPSNLGQGMYLRVERPVDVIKRLYPGDDGNFYKADGDGYHNGDLTRLGTLTEYTQKYGCSTGNPYTAWVDLSNLTWAINQPVSNLASTITNHVKDLREWASLFAVNTAINNSEPGMLQPAGISGDELRIYGDRKKQFTWLGWDYSDVLSVGDGQGRAPIAWGYAGGAQNTVQNFLFNPPMVSYYAGALLDVLNNVMGPSNMNAWINEMGSAATNLGTDWRTTYLANVVNLRNALVSQLNTNLTIMANGQAVTSDFAVVSTRNDPVQSVVLINQNSTGWKDLGEYTFTAVTNEYVKLTRIAPTNSTMNTVADALMLSNNTTMAILDNSDPRFSTNSGLWSTKAGGYGGGYIASTEPGAAVSWYAPAPSAGVYRVYAYTVKFLSPKGSDTNAEYRVTPYENRISLALSGLAPQGYTTRVLANGSDCSWVTKSGTWSTLANMGSGSPTFPVTIQAVDAEGDVLKSRTFTAVGLRNPSTKSGGISSDTLWSGKDGTIIVTGEVAVTAAATLTIASNTTVLFEPNASIVVANGTLDLQGTLTHPVLLYARSGASSWKIEASGSSVITGIYARLVGGRLVSGPGAQIALQDCTLSSYAGADGIIHCNQAGAAQLLRCTVTNFGTTVFLNTPTFIDECLFSGVGICGIDLQNATSLATVRRTTVETSSASAVDGMRFSQCTVGLVSNCMVHTLSGTGLVLNASAPTIDGSLIYGVYAGVAASGPPLGLLNRTTIANTTFGIKNGAVVLQDCIIWSNTVSALGGPASAAYCDIELTGTNLYPGIANRNRTPWFRDTLEHDFRLLPISPCLTAGSGGAAIGAVFPLGAAPAAPEGLWITNVSAAQAELHWTDNSNDEQWFEIQNSPDGTSWQSITNTPAHTTNWTVQGLLQGSPYVFRVRAAHERGASLFSEEVAIVTPANTTLQSLRDNLRIMELMYNPPAPPAGSPFLDNDDFEYIELQNIGSSSLDLSGLYFTNGITFTFTNGTVLDAGQRLMLVQNGAAFASRYPDKPFLGVYGPSNLSNTGERIRIKDASGNTVLDFTYADSSSTRWYPSTDGEGFSLVLANTSGDPNDPTSWRASSLVNGSPDALDPEPPYGTILINEVLSHQDQDNPGDWIELYNAGTGEVDVSYWFLSDNETTLTNYQIAAGTTILPGEYRVFTESTNFGTNVLGSSGFALSEFGDSVYLSSSDSSNQLTSYRTFVKFGAAENSVTFGRHLRSDGEYDFTALSAPTMGNSNAYPKVGPVVINEVMYNPFAGGKEFVEILNITAGPVALFDVDYPTNTWQFDGAITYVFPANTWLAAGEHALVTSVDAAEFRQVSGLTNSDVRIFGPFNGALANNSETIKLYKPNMPEFDGFVPYVLADRVQYTDAAPWPVIANNGGPSLERISPLAYGNDPSNWMAVTLGGTPGALNNTNRLPVVSFLVPDGAGFETNTTVTIAVSLYPPSESTVTVQYAVIGGTATNSIDYAFADGALVFWPNETSKTLSLGILDNVTPDGEPDETVIVGLSAVSSNAVLGGTKQFTYTIIDTDTTNLPSPTISPSGTHYFTNYSVTVTMSHTVPGGIIRYTVDGSLPTVASTLYLGPFSQTFGARVTARTFLGSFDSSPSISTLYIARTPLPGQTPTKYLFTVQTNGIGTVIGGNVWVTDGANATALASPDAHSMFEGWTGDTNGASTTSNSLTILMNAPRTVTAHFAEKTTAKGTSQRWLAAFYPATNDYDSAALSDTDGDGMAAWEEYEADTIPTDPESVLRFIQAVRQVDTLELLWLSRTTRSYFVERSTNMMDGWLQPPLTSGVRGLVSGTNYFTDPDPPADKAFYRIGVEIP